MYGLPMGRLVLLALVCGLGWGFTSTNRRQAHPGSWTLRSSSSASAPASSSTSLPSGAKAGRSSPPSSSSSAVPASSPQQPPQSAAKIVPDERRIFPLPPPGQEEPDRRIWTNIVDPLRRSLELKRFDIFVRTLKNFAFTQDYITPVHHSKKREEPVLQLKTSASSFGNDPEQVCADLTEMIGAPGVLDSFVSPGISDIIWSMGKIGIRFRKSEEKQLLFRAVGTLIERHAVHPLSSKDVTTFTGGLARAGIRFSSLEPQFQRDIMRVYGDVAVLFNDREVSNILHSLTKIGLSWAELSIAAKNGLLESFVRESPKLFSQQGSMSIYALGILNLNIDAITPAVRDRIYLVALGVLRDDAVQAKEGGTFMMRRYSVQQISNVIYGLAKLGCDYESLPLNVRAAMENALGVMDLMNEQEVANVAYSFGIMQAQWKSLSPDIQERFKSNIIRCLGIGVSQGLSNTIYGLGLMRVEWGSMGPEYASAVLRALVRVFGPLQDARPPNSRGPANIGPGPQSIANIIYSLGVQGAEWESFPEDARNALATAVDVYCGQLTTQEMSNTIYGLGMLRASFDTLPPRLLGSILRTVQRVVREEGSLANEVGLASQQSLDSRLSTLFANQRAQTESSKTVPALVGESRRSSLNEQEVCSTLHGLAKMNANWDKLPVDLRHTLLEMVSQLAEIGNLCLACTAYSLGVMGAQWSSFPKKIRDLLVAAAGERPLEDQTMSNVVYGLSLLGVQWGEMDSQMRDLLVASLAREDCFSMKEMQASQHVCNTIWGLAKMDATWVYLPQEVLLRSLQQQEPNLSSQETANAFYGLAVMDASWTGLPAFVHETFERAFDRNVLKMTIQEVANCMYSITLLTFDCPYVAPGPDNDPDMALIWRLHERLIEAFGRIPYANWSVENYDQFAIYFELLTVLPGGREMVIRILGSIPGCSGPTGTVPSRLHTQCAHAMLDALNAQTKSGAFSVFNEFNGLGGVFPVDVGVYYRERLVAFVEIDGEFHYKYDGYVDDEAAEGAERDRAAAETEAVAGPGPGVRAKWLVRQSSLTRLRRKDQLKEFCYRRRYPNTPLFRIRSDQCEELGFPRVGAALASWIIESLKEKKAAARSA